MSEAFHSQIIAILPRLRVQALALTRNRSAAEDLVQDAVCNALSAKDSFIEGTNFSAWMHRILRNRFISDLRRRKITSGLDDVPPSFLATIENHEDRLALKDLAFALDLLAEDQREALILVVLHGMSYQELAEATDCAVGTAKSRVFRARKHLMSWMNDELPENNRLRLKAGNLKGNLENSAIWARLWRRGICLCLKLFFSTDLESFSRERDNAVVAWSLHMGALPVSEPLKMEKKEKKTEIKQGNMKKADVAFELWLKKGLHQLFDDVANEPVPQELLDLIERDRNT